MLEVELKFPIDDRDAITEKLAALGAVAGAAVEQADAYFNHPARDFAETDEALRVRTVGGASVITYKGPKQGGGAKTRYELELPLGEHAQEDWAELLTRLGFRAVAVVRKRRTPFELEQQGRAFEVVIDEVEGLGDGGLGLFAEVETVAPPDEKEAAERAVVNLAERLGLLHSEPRSYLGMLLAR